MSETSFKSGYVSIIGEPNVGKSTLLNAILGEKLAIVTPKPQTTRNQIRGILSGENYQIVFLDTPGILAPKYELHDWMVRTAYAAIQDADLVLYLADVTILILPLSLTLETPSLITISPSFNPDITETLPKFLLPISIFFFSAVSSFTV